jgi:hypothetical protein
MTKTLKQHLGSKLNVRIFDNLEKRSADEEFVLELPVKMSLDMVSNEIRNYFKTFKKLEDNSQEDMNLYFGTPMKAFVMLDYQGIRDKGIQVWKVIRYGEN